MILGCLSKITLFCLQENELVSSERFIFQSAIQFLITHFLVKDKEIVCIKTMERKCCLQTRRQPKVSHIILLFLKNHLMFFPVAYFEMK